MIKRNISVFYDEQGGGCFEGQTVDLLRDVREKNVRETVHLRPSAHRTVFITHFLSSQIKVLAAVFQQDIHFTPLNPQ